MTAGRRRPSEAGATLIEILITVMILGVAFVAFLGGMGTSIMSSDLHRRQAQGETLVRRFAEAVKGTPCAATCPLSYSPGFTPPAGFDAPTATVACYATDNTTVVACPSPGMQVVSLRVKTTDGRVDESLDIVKRPS